MVPIPIPEEGLVLQAASAASTEPPSQVLRLDLASGVLEDIMRASKTGKDVHMSFGKNVTLHYGNRSQQLLSIAQPTQSELYKYTPDQQDELRFAGLITHKLAQKKVQETIASTDAAMEALISTMADHQQNKNNKKIKVLSDTPTASPRVKTNYVKGKPTTFFTAIPKRQAPVRSIPTSPAVIPAHRPPATHPSSPRVASQPTSTNTSNKMDALKIPLLHLVAIRPMSLKFLAKKVSCSQEECKQVLEKLGKPFRLDPEKWDLTDKAFKELSVWDFKYELDEDRQLAIDHAISAFDRLRLSREDRVWQMLLPPEDRSKGKVLSKLQVHQGPMQTQKSVTPRIHVQETEDPVNDNPAPSEGAEKDHLTPGHAGTPTEQTKKKRLSEQEAQSKRLLSSGPKKAAAAAATKAKESREKDMTKKKVARKEGAAQANVKSAEFVHDSDEEEEAAAAEEAKSKLAPRPSAAPKTSDIPSKRSPAPTAAPKTADVNAKIRTSPGTKPQVAATASNKGLNECGRTKTSTKTSNDSIGQTNNRDRSSSTVGAATSNHRSSDASQTSSSGPKLARQRTTSSPHKPSPLGSSPPTNASDFDNDSQLQTTSNSSTSSTPMDAQIRNAGLKPRPEASKRILHSPERSLQPSTKRKADDNPSLTNGHTAPAVKRIKTSVPTPPATETSSSESSPVSDRVLDQAQRFKGLYDKYQRFYQELAAQANPAPEKMDKLMRMHERVQLMKEEISRAVVYK
ncbi:MAG: hypothetical protein Q9169_000515 [Polycauliona sp. 2 TL-2023]